ncbi:hypothetical protein PUN28_001989 [Cardiocondyla obscurior]|uniref:Uncharacterized protein n=1 Tax=Cardiocondyla obscurior TaxID=286306 RepID=A0AAW2GRZ5_9HYME
MGKDISLNLLRKLDTENTPLLTLLTRPTQPLCSTIILNPSPPPRLRHRPLSPSEPLSTHYHPRLRPNIYQALCNIKIGYHEIFFMFTIIQFSQLLIYWDIRHLGALLKPCIQKFFTLPFWQYNKSFKFFVHNSLNQMLQKLYSLNLYKYDVNIFTFSVAQRLLSYVSGILQ